MGTNTEKSGNFVSPEKWEPCEQLYGIGESRWHLIWDHTSSFRLELRLQWMLLSEMRWLGNNFERQISKTNSRPEWIHVDIFPIPVPHTLHKFFTDFTSEIHTMAHVSVTLILAIFCSGICSGL